MLELILPREVHIKVYIIFQSHFHHKIATEFHPDVEEKGGIRREMKGLLNSLKFHQVSLKSPNVFAFSTAGRQRWLPALQALGIEWHLHSWPGLHMKQFRSNLE